MLSTISSSRPLLRSVVLISVAVVALAVAFLADTSHHSAAQTVEIDYDLDDDGLIEVSNADQWRAISDDVDGDGIVADASAYWNTTGYPNASTAAGCPARDHDDDSATPDEASCIGYELIADISPASGVYVQGTYTARLVGNGFRILNPNPGSDSVGGLFGTLQYSSTVEGVGVINPRVGDQGDSSHGGIVQRLEGKVIGSYVLGGDIRGDNAAGIAQAVTTHATGGYGLIAHSYVRGTRIGDAVSGGHAGLGGTWEHQRGTSPVYQSTCLNSYASVTFVANTPLEEGIIGEINQNGQARVLNCVGDRTTDDEPAFGTNNPAGDPYRFTKAQMTGVTDYDAPRNNNPFSTWDDYPIDGSLDQLNVNAPRTDVWDFGDETTFPVLKGWGHDRSAELDRQLSGTDTVNLCTRTLAVASEIIRLLKDDIFADGVTGPVPAEVASLTDCPGRSSIRNVSIDNLRDYAVTTASNPFNLNPDEPVAVSVGPSRRKISSLDRNDFAYLVNVAHIDLSNNSFTTLPPRLFQGLPLSWLDLSNNLLATLPADLFAGLQVGATSGSLVNPPAPPGQFVGGTVYLNGNELTDTGIPARIFDELSELNGLDLSDNSLTRVNTRWFEQLANLGRRSAAITTLQPGLGLHLAGNAVTEHYYSPKLFTGIRENVVRYSGTTAGDDLRDAIVAAITAEAGGTTPTTLDLDTTDYYVRTGQNEGYQPTGTTCPSGATVGSGRLRYLSSAMPDCYVVPHWSAPQLPGATATPDPKVGLEQDGNRLLVTIAHTASDGFIGYQIRYREIPADPNAEYCVTYLEVLQICYDELPDDPVEGWTQDWILVAISAGSGTKTVEVADVDAAARHQVEVRALSRSRPMSETVVAAEPPMNVELDQELDTGALKLSWDSPDHYVPAGYEYRTRATGSQTWSDWTRVEHQGARGSRQETFVTGVTYGVEYEFQVRVVGAADVDQTTVITDTPFSGLPRVTSIKPSIREVSVRAGERIRLAVDIYSAQYKMDNDLPSKLNGRLIFSWSEMGIGGGSFAAPSNSRQVTYTAPSLPGTYTVKAEAQPDGICRTHHDGEAEITAEDRAPCIATFTIRVSRAPVDAVQQPDPINPAGIIPTSLTDNEGIAYSVFTPVDGGTFTGEGFTVSADAGAVPDRSLLGVSASVSAVPVPAPVPGASMSVAGLFYDINGIAQDGTAPLSSYTLDEPLMACLPFPDEFRADLSNVVAVEQRADGSLGILTSKVRTTSGGLTVCGAISTLPATVGIAKLGTVPAVPPTPMPEEELPEAGGTAPNATVIVLILLAGMLLLTAISRIGRIKRSWLPQS